MFKRNCPEKNKASMGCLRETRHIQKEKNNNNKTKIRRKTKQKHKNNNNNNKKQHRMWKRNTPQKKEKRNEKSMGCVRETPQTKMKPAWDV